MRYVSWVVLAAALILSSDVRAISPGQDMILFGRGQSTSGGGGGGSCANGNTLLNYSDPCQLMSQMVGN